MPSASKPYLCSRSTAGPDSPYTSRTPTRRIGTGCCSASTEATASPRPPIIECSSAVTTRPVFFALATTRRLGGSKRLGDHKAAGDDRHIGPLAHDYAAADLELIVLAVVDDRRRQAAEAHVDRPLKLVGGAHAGAGLDIVGGNNHRHARNRAHERNVLAALVRSAVLAHRNARVGSTDLDVEMRVADGVADLLVGAAGGKHGKGAREGNAARSRDAGGKAHQVALGDTGIIEALGIGGLKLAGLRGGRQVSIENHEVIALVAQLDKRLAVAYARGDFFDLCH